MFGGEKGRRLVDRAFRSTLKGRYRPTGVRCPIVLYHGIGESGGPWTVTPARFRRQIEWLSETFDLLTVSEAIEQWKQGSLPPDPAVVTFDDGFQSTIETALPILESHGVEATHYVVPGLLGERFEGSRVMDRDSVIDLSESGHEIGAHTMTHPDLTTVGREIARREIVESRESIEAITGDNPRSFAYPYGAFDDDIAQLVREAGYESATTVIGSDVVDFAAPMSLPRITIMREHDRQTSRDMIDGDRRWQHLIRDVVPIR
ncbi:polysaccharide deacetylase family protein [Halalkalicoccus subterraneus]|uniref:polysaccharide deacetylase family protein n=1 Tax=Halalkalicoccus subterraneus TaxID=2675002 RepID=UPI001FE8D337|nr:polysaccharide deacetylase family protein [Halalkalicoccus subterraneus]